MKPTHPFLRFSSVVESMLLVALGLRPSPHAAARKLGERLPVSLAESLQRRIAAIQSGGVPAAQPR